MVSDEFVTALWRLIVSNFYIVRVEFGWVLAIGVSNLVFLCTS
ncbi:hypothetical protein M6B38_327570 [Iris pallida]|uniref:Uncharacterized protein n=1 Tax=Iris pallida TaxID=29817 RepID=A0AAX6H5R3_IRIPA|nr:hypothetical protein M6B38_327570 [Iris pallida]